MTPPVDPATPPVDPATLRMHAVVIDCAGLEGPIAFWSAALGYVDWFARQGQFAGITPPVPDGRLPIIFQLVPEPKVGKNRVHLDYETPNRPAEIARLVGLGAREIGEHSLGDARWTIMADPDGNEFCVVGA
jgi:hypothetical protein